MLKNYNYNFKQISLNFGPQHPAAHGVLRLALQLNNERIIKCDPHIGLLHRATEYLMKTKSFYLSLPYFDRLDYVSMLTQEHAYTLALEKINKNYLISNTVKKTRIIMDEITRILNHFLALACHALDVGAMSIIFWAFEERENFLEIYENYSGARMHTAATRPFFFNKLLKNNLVSKLNNTLLNVPITITEINSVLNNNKIWKMRLKNVGLLNINSVFNISISGVMIRSIGMHNDARINKNMKYSYYNKTKINSYLSIEGDCLSRYYLRTYEIVESLNIISSLISKIKFTKSNNFISMENVIESFKIWSNSVKMPTKSSFSYIESPKGLFGVYIKLNKNNVPTVVKIKSPSYNHLFLLKQASKGLMLADLITLIGTIDIVFGEIDR